MRYLTLGSCMPSPPTPTSLQPTTYRISSHVTSLSPQPSNNPYIHTLGSTTTPIHNQEKKKKKSHDIPLQYSPMAHLRPLLGLLRRPQRGICQTHHDAIDEYLGDSHFHRSRRRRRRRRREIRDYCGRISERGEFTFFLYFSICFFFSFSKIQHF